MDTILTTFIILGVIILITISIVLSYRNRKQTKKYEAIAKTVKEISLNTNPKARLEISKARYSSFDEAVHAKGKLYLSPHPGDTIIDCQIDRHNQDIQLTIKGSNGQTRTSRLSLRYLPNDGYINDLPANISIDIFLEEVIY